MVWTCLTSIKYVILCANWHLMKTKTLFCLKTRSLHHPTMASKGQSYGDSIGSLSTSPIISRVIPITFIMGELSFCLHYGFPKTVFIKKKKTFPIVQYWFSRMQQNRPFISISLHQNFSVGDWGHGPNALFTMETLTPTAPSEREEHSNSHRSPQEPCCVWLPCLLQSQFSLSFCGL